MRWLTRMLGLCMLGHYPHPTVIYLRNVTEKQNFALLTLIVFSEKEQRVFSVSFYQFQNNLLCGFWKSNFKHPVCKQIISVSTVFAWYCRSTAIRASYDFYDSWIWIWRSRVQFQFKFSLINLWYFEVNSFKIII